jgi:hypothetical protein
MSSIEHVPASPEHCRETVVVVPTPVHVMIAEPT